MFRKVWIGLLLMLMMSREAASQGISQRLQNAFKRFESDTQLSNALISLYVIDGKTGAVIFDHNATVGMAPASTQKIITASAAYEILGKDYRYKTSIGYRGEVVNGLLNGPLVVKGSGDPTLGSWRWKQTSEDSVVNRFGIAVKRSGIRKYMSLVADTTGWQDETIPGGWIWEDIGNYYGSGANMLNWRENQYDLYLKSGNHIGDPVQITGIKPDLIDYQLVSDVTAAEKGTGDQTIIYFPVTGKKGIIRGTIPMGETGFEVSGAIPSVGDQLLYALKNTLVRNGVTPDSNASSVSKENNKENIKIIYSEQSPSLDSIVYWFLKKSINLYGEALAKTIADKKGVHVSTYNGVSCIKSFWKEKGIPLTELNMFDGSGLSPLNRVTTHAQVSILKYAQDQSWFDGFYDALPEYNGMKMKSGTINGVKGFCGYQKTKDGHSYIFSFLVNNYNGTSSKLVNKMYEVLNELKS